MTRPINAALLVRISEDKIGDAAGVGRQEQDARALAERLGWEIGEVFIENDTSAFKRRRIALPDGSTAMRVHRPEFRRLLDLIANGMVDGLIAYHLDRVARDPRDLEDLIDAVERAGIPVESVTGSLRLSSDADITMARIGVAIANQSSRDSSRRIKRKHEELAASGRFAGGGVRRFGYEKDGVTIRESEAETLRWAAQKVLEGETVTSLCRQLDERGVKPVRAEHWSSRSLQDQLVSGRVAGLRVHRGEIVGEAEWPAILDRETWDAVVATIQTRANGYVRPALTRWLTGLLYCDNCGRTLVGSKIRGTYRYWCTTHRNTGCGRIAIAGPGVEREVEEQVLGFLGRPDVVAQLAASASGNGHARARIELAQDEEQLRELSRLWATKAITLSEYAEARRIIDDRISAAKGAISAHIPARIRAIALAEDHAAAWKQLPPLRRRELVKVLVEAQGFVGWTVKAADLSKPRRFDPARLTLRPLG